MLKGPSFHIQMMYHRLSDQNPLAEHLKGCSFFTVMNQNSLIPLSLQVCMGISVGSILRSGLWIQRYVCLNFSQILPLNLCSFSPIFYGHACIPYTWSFHSLSLMYTLIQQGRGLLPIIYSLPLRVPATCSPSTVRGVVLGLQEHQTFPAGPGGWRVMEPADLERMVRK